MDEVRVVTFNTAAGNPRVTTPQRDFLALSLYREIIDGSSAGAPILALQEVGPEQAAALKRAAAAGTFALLHVARPGQGNALLVPARYRVLAHRSRYFVAAHLRARRVDVRQRFEARMWTQALLHDTASGRDLTVFNTHLSGDGNLRLEQARALLRRVHAVRGPVILAGDLNVRPAGDGVDVQTRALLAPLRDMAPDAVDARRAAVDWILAAGFEPVSARLYTGDALRLDGIGDAERISDHYAKEARLRFSR